MQKLILIAFREMLSEPVWNALTEVVSLLFQILCSTKLYVNKVQELKGSVANILCNLEKIFSLAFFDSMEHLIVHLPYEARVREPVKYRWMYPFESLSPRPRTTIPRPNQGFGGDDRAVAVVGCSEGKNKARVFSLGSEAHVSSRTYTSPLPPPPIPPWPQPNPTMEDRIGRLDIAMMREMRASSSIAGPL
ncbi:UNVERIFIED_CONTAM: hypothetical protein Slati_4218800 [Sesamum latifolium]|uniref:DUF4218 domain-containing protein n=1 Tax=Sesamum latifolium TaxID=2727402 RepID=A0AAW2TAW5_9LAMI